MVEIVGDATTQLPHGLHFLGDSQLRLRLLQGLVSFNPFCDVARYLGVPNEFVILIPNGIDYHQRINWVPSFPVVKANRGRQSLSLKMTPN